MAEIAAPAVALRIPVVRQLDLRVLVAGSGQEHQRVAPLRVIFARQLDQAERIPIEAQGLLDIGDADHSVQILHGGVLDGAAPGSGRGARIWRKRCIKANWAASSSIAAPTIWARRQFSGAARWACRCASCRPPKPNSTGSSRTANM